MTLAPQIEGRSERDILLQVADLHVQFRTGRGLVRAVDGVSLTLARGESLGIVGESGSGRTTLARAVMGLLPRGAITSGSVRVSGSELLGLPHRAMLSRWGRQLAMVFQDPTASLNPVMKVGRQITEPLRLHLGMSRTAARDAAEALLRDLRVPEPERRMRQYPHELSGGLRQRVMIAIALSCGPQLLVADEPTTALDVTVQAQILELIGEQRRRRRMSVVLVTHDLGVVAAHTDHVAVMYAGRLVERAPTRVLFGEVKMPYTLALMRSIPRLDHAGHTPLATIPGRPPDPLDTPRGCRFAPRCPSARELCRHDEPPLVAARTPDHVYACWYPVGSTPPDERKGQR